VTALIFQGNLPIERIAANDRGLAYGDGLFETVLMDHGEPVLWGLHWQRLAEGARRLSIALPEEGIMLSAARELAGERRAVIKVILTRGESGRGYAPVSGPGTAIVSVHDAPHLRLVPIAVRWCHLQMSNQPVLAGIKHLNRLENVLARSEWTTDDYAEGLLCDGQGNVICATSANVFIHRKGRWSTPDLSCCGIAGVARQSLLQLDPAITVARISRDAVMKADAVFLCNSVRGMMEVNRIESNSLPASDAFRELKQRFISRHPAFATG
jgi:4-amino-4-deoxychorismate lyase